MARITSRHANPDHGNGHVSVSYGVAWSESDLRNAEIRRRFERLVDTMPRVTENTYRENAGRASLDIEVSDGTFDDVFELLAQHPKTFIEYDADEFVGVDADGESHVPGPATILKTLKREAVQRGLMIGEQSVMDADDERRTDVFRVCLRGEAANASKLPKWWLELADDLGVAVPDGPALPDGFARLPAVDDEIEVIEVKDADDLGLTLAQE